MPKNDWFSNFETLDGCFAIINNDHPCKVEGICTVCIKMFDGNGKGLKKVRYVPQVKTKSYLCWYLGSIGP